MAPRLAALLPALMLGAAFTGRPGWLGFGLGYSITTCVFSYPQGLTPGGGNHLDDAAGLVLSIAVLLATCALLRGPGPRTRRETPGPTPLQCGLARSFPASANES
jgi:uncharacterized membrane protein YccC